MIFFASKEGNFVYVMYFEQFECSFGGLSYILFLRINEII